MVERHYDDEALASLMDSDLAGSDAHLPSCTVCREKLESFRMIADALADRDVWDTRHLDSTPVPETISNLRAFADRMTREDTQAETFLRDLLSGPRETWAAKLAQHPEWRTAGTVRKLIAASDRAIDTMPPDAVAITELATDIADHLDPSSHTSDTVARLRGAAWRDYAYALFYTGQFADAERAIFVADSHFSDCVVDEYDRARVGIVKALVNRAMEKFVVASQTAIASAESFAAFGDVRRLASARLAEVHLLFSRSDYTTALPVLRSLEKQLRNSDDADTHLRVLGNLGVASWRSGKIDEALRYYEEAAATADLLGIESEGARLRWNVASVLIDAGRTIDAAERLKQIVADFSRLGMTSEAAIASIERAELLLANKRFDEVAEICRAAIATFETAGVAYTAKALTAFAFLKEAVDQRTATPKIARHVRDYIRRLPQEQHLLFLPPPPG